MAATKVKNFAWKNRRAIGIAPVVALLLVGYQNCSVDLAGTTPGASVKEACSPSTQALTDFEPVLNDLLQAQGAIGATTSLKCGGCHATTGTHDYASIARSVFLIQSGDTTTQPELLKTNYCTVADRAAMLSTKLLSGPHTGGLYQSTDIQTLLDFLESHF